MKTVEKPTYISLFSSAGIGCYGFKLEGFDCVATNELITRRLEVQKFNKKCKYESGYICGDITKDATKMVIHLRSAVGTKNKSRQRIRFADCTASTRCSDQFLSKMPCFRINDCFLRVFKHCPLIGSIDNVLFLLVRFTGSTEVYGIAHILGTLQNILYRTTAPVIRIQCFKVILIPSEAVTRLVVCR